MIALVTGVQTCALPISNLLFRNESGRRFVRQDLTPVAPGRSARQSSWVDFDNDGDLDLFASNRSGPNALFRQDAGRFVRVDAQQAGDDARPTGGACGFDYEREHRPNLLNTERGEGGEGVVQ